MPNNNQESTLPASDLYSFHGHFDSINSAADFITSGFSQADALVTLL